MSRGDRTSIDMIRNDLDGDMYSRSTNTGKSPMRNRGIACLHL